MPKHAGNPTDGLAMPLLDALPIAVYVIQDERLVYLNTAGRLLVLGPDSTEDPTGSSMLRFAHADSHAGVIDRVQRAQSANPDTQPRRLQAQREDGTVIPVETTAASVIWQGRPALAVVARIIEDSPYASETRAFTAGRPRPLIVVDGQGRISRWNKAATDLFARPAVEMIGKTLEETAVGWNVRIIGQALATALSDNRPVVIDALQYRRIDGQEGWLRVEVVPHALGDDPHQMAAITAEDISERHRQELLAHHSQKLEAVGQLAAGIAHEINTPIQFIGDNLHFLADAFRDLTGLVAAYEGLATACREQRIAGAAVAAIDTAISAADVDFLQAEIPKALTQSSEGVQRVATIVKAMKDFSHPDTTERLPVDLNQTILTTLTVARNEYKYVAEVATTLDADLPMVPCYAGEISQVLLNLLVNAAHAIAEAQTARQDKSKGLITIATRRDGDRVEIRIADSGTGVPEAVRHRLFEPFFTTKPVGKGTGQGLYLSHQIITHRHGGSITFTTEMGRGTTFIIRLPCEPVDA